MAVRWRLRILVFIGLSPWAQSTEVLEPRDLRNQASATPRFNLISEILPPHH